MPARRSSAQVRISGRPTSAVGSSDSTASSSAMPSVSIFALPAQSYGRLGAQVALDLGVVEVAKAHR